VERSISGVNGVKEDGSRREMDREGFSRENVMGKFRLDFPEKINIEGFFFFRDNKERIIIYTFSILKFFKFFN